MSFFTPIVISQKIEHNKSLLKTKSFIASFGIHATLLASISYFMTTHPIPLPKAEERVVISLSEFTSTDGDIHRLESVITKKPTLPKPLTKATTLPKPQKSPPTPTPEVTPMKQPSMSPEASAPLAQTPTPIQSSPKTVDSPKISPNVPSHETEKAPAPVSNEIGGAALGHIRAMIENAITYPAIARKLRLEGVVLVTFILKSDGTVDTAQVKSTSGSNLLDKKALQTILSLSGDYPSLGKTFELSIPIAFNLHKS